MCESRWAQQGRPRAKNKGENQKKKRRKKSRPIETCGVSRADIETQERKREEKEGALRSGTALTRRLGKVPF
jgi:hypothetical protein